MFPIMGMGIIVGVIQNIWIQYKFWWWALIVVCSTGRNKKVAAKEKFPASMMKHISDITYPKAEVGMSVRVIVSNLVRSLGDRRST